MRYFFRVEYDGTAYGGWQLQNNSTTIQEKLELAFSTVTRRACAIVGAGRTDAGVHARGQGAHLDTEVTLDVRQCELSVNAVLPPDIAIYHLQPVSPEFHARFSALSRRYRYSMAVRKRPLLYKKVWMVFYSVDWERVRNECGTLVGTHDFTSFCASGSSAKHANCTVSEARLDKEGDLYVFSIEANRFVYNMVRSIVGTLIDIGRGHKAGPVLEILESKDRFRAGATAPACGLVLDHVAYSGADE